MTEIKTIIDAATAELEEHRKKMQELSKATFEKVSKAFFENHPEVKTIYWAQWIPGFNDGDPCTFTMSDVMFSPNDWKEIDGPYFDDELDDDEDSELKPAFEKYSSYKNTNPPTPLQESMRSMENFLGNIEDHLEATFTSYAFIRMHKGGVETEDYDCGY